MEKMPQHTLGENVSPEAESQLDFGDLVRNLRDRGDFENLMEKIAES